MRSGKTNIRSGKINHTNADVIIADVSSRLARTYGRAERHGNARIITFGTALTCSLNYSKLLRGNKYFFGLPAGILGSPKGFPETSFGDFILLICGSAEQVLVLPRTLMLGMMEGVSSRRVDIFVEGSSYILQTTKHPKIDVTQYLNQLPVTENSPFQEGHSDSLARPNRTHVVVQFNLIMLGRAEGCSVWVPVNDRNLACDNRPFSAHTIAKLPNFGFEENTRRIIQNIDVLWLSGNVIRKAFEIESTTSIYSGLLRINDLVLAQPNIQIDLFIAASRARRERVYSQLLRPSFRTLISKCSFISFEEIETQAKRLEVLSSGTDARVSGLIRGERFNIPEHYSYPAEL